MPPKKSKKRVTKAAPEPDDEPNNQPPQFEASTYYTLEQMSELLAIGAVPNTSSTDASQPMTADQTKVRGKDKAPRTQTSPNQGSHEQVKRRGKAEQRATGAARLDLECFTVDEALLQADQTMSLFQWELVPSLTGITREFAAAIASPTVAGHPHLKAFNECRALRSLSTRLDFSLKLLTESIQLWETARGEARTMNEDDSDLDSIGWEMESDN